MGVPSTGSYYLPSLVGNTIIEVVHSFENKCSLDSDGLSIKFIKQIIDSIVEPLTRSLNLSFQQGRIPHQLITCSLCRVVQIYKSGKHTSVDNYRPIRLTLVISRIMEKIVFNILTNFLEHKNVICQHHMGSGKITQLFIQLYTFSILLQSLLIIKNLQLQFSALMPWIVQILLKKTRTLYY